MAGAVFIVGPTSVGKSSLALRFAAQIGGEIVNADAFQVYEGLELLTSRPRLEVQRRVPHHLFGKVPLSEPYSVARYLTEATACLAAIRDRGRPAVVVGGTGLYVKALTHGLSPLPPSDPAIRAHLETQELPALLETLRAADPVSAGQIDAKNKRRVVRALEVCLVTGQPFSSHREEWKHSVYGEAGAGVFLDCERETLRNRIDRQVEHMFEAGVVEEVSRIDQQALGATAAGAIGLAEILQLSDGRLSLAECKERVKTRTAQYAKRQVTWFKKERVFRRVTSSLECDALVSLLEALSGRR